MTTVDEMIKASMARMIERKMGFESVEVSSWEEEIERGWSNGCDTCGYGADDDTYKVTIYYKHSGITRQTYYIHEGTFADLIKELDA